VSGHHIVKVIRPVGERLDRCAGVVFVPSLPDLGQRLSRIDFSGKRIGRDWLKANDDEPFPPFADAALSDLRARAAELDCRSRLSA
jgi:hypothetical protein